MRNWTQYLQWNWLKLMNITQSLYKAHPPDSLHRRCVHCRGKRLLCWLQYCVCGMLDSTARDVCNAPKVWISDLNQGDPSQCCWPLHEIQKQNDLFLNFQNYTITHWPPIETRQKNISMQMQLPGLLQKCKHHSKGIFSWSAWRAGMITALVHMDIWVQCCRQIWTLDDFLLPAFIIGSVKERLAWFFDSIHCVV